MAASALRLAWRLAKNTLRETFDLPVTVIRHPSRGCPYILPA